MRTYTRLIAALVLAGALAATSCAGNQTPIAAVAKPATSVEQTGSAILRAAQAAHAQTNPFTNQPIISTQQLDNVALVCDKLGRIGITLAKALSDYSALKAAGGNTAALAVAIQSLVADATAALDTIGKSIPNGTVAAIDQAVTEALGLWAQINAGVL